MQKTKYITLEWLNKRWGSGVNICEDAQHDWYALNVKKIHIKRIVEKLMEGYAGSDYHDWLRYLVCIYFTEPIEIDWRTTQRKLKISDEVFGNPHRLGKWFLRQLKLKGRA